MSWFHRLIIALALGGLLAIVAIGGIDEPANAPPSSDSEGEQEAATQEEEEYAPAEVLVKFKERTSKSKKQEVHGNKGGRTKETIPAIDVDVVAVERGKEKAKAKEYKDDPNVEFAEVNGVYEAIATAPDDPGAPYQWQFNNTDSTTNDSDIDAYEAWSGGSTTAWDGGTTGSGSVAIAILDTGIKEDHVDLTGKVTKRTNLTNSSTNDDVNGHGTHVGGSAAALTNNQKGGAGTCPGCALYNVKVLGDTGSGSFSQIAKGVSWAADNGAKVINMSLGGPDDSQTIHEAVNYAYGFNDDGTPYKDSSGNVSPRRAVLVAAAGNDNTSTQSYPAAYTNVVAVGATDNQDARAYFSNYGSSWVDVAAPGVGILSTVIDDPSTTAVEAYGRKSGTSMASPHVAGEAGLIWSKSGLCAAGDNACVRNQIESKADRTSGTGTGTTDYWANGRINANGGVEGGTTTAASPSDTTAPTVSTRSPSSGQTGVRRATNVTATFSEEMDKATLTKSTVTLVKSGATTPLTATVTSTDGKTVTLDPSASLAGRTTYTVKIEGAKDLAGNPLATTTWSFKTRR